MTSIPKLSNTQWAWTQNPSAFLARLKERAENLFHDGYDVSAVLNTVGVFVVISPDETEYTVDIVNQTCTCSFFTKAEIPQCPTCKHLLGLPELVNQKIILLTGLANQHDIAGHRRQGHTRWLQRHKLVGAWARAMEQAEANACEMDVDTYREWKMENESGRWELEAAAA